MFIIFYLDKQTTSWIWMNAKRRMWYTLYRWPIKQNYSIKSRNAILINGYFWIFLFYNTFRQLARISSRGGRWICTNHVTRVASCDQIDGMTQLNNFVALRRASFGLNAPIYRRLTRAIYGFIGDAFSIMYRKYTSFRDPDCQCPNIIRTWKFLRKIILEQAP